MMSRANAQWLQKYLNESYFTFFYAGYANDDDGDVAIFETKKQRDAWVKQGDLVERCKLSLIDVLRRIGLGLCTMPREKDAFDPTIIWVVNNLR